MSADSGNKAPNCTSYKTLLLIRDALDEVCDAELVKLLRNKWNVYTTIKTFTRPEVEVGVVGGKSILRIAGNPSVDADLKLNIAFVRGELKVFCQNPAAELALFNGASGYNGGKVWEFTYDGRRDAYTSRRLLTCKQVAIDVGRAMEEWPVGIRWGLAGDNLAKGILRPEEIPIGPDDAYALLFSAEGEKIPLQKFSVGLLPPYRDDFEGTYFDAAHVKVRGFVDRLIDSSLPEGTLLPAAIDLWRLCEENCYRDILLEGGGLHLSYGDNLPSTIRLELRTGANDFVAKWRKGFILDADREMGPDWLEGFRRAFRSDLEQPRPGVTVEVASAPAGNHVAGMWDLPSPEALEARDAPRKGSWNLIMQLLGRLPSEQESSAAAAADDGEERLPNAAVWVLDYSRGGQDYPPNHAQAEQLFMRHLWHSPWPQGDDSVWETECWRQVMVELIQELACEPGEIKHPRERSAFEGVELEKSGDHYVLTHGAEVNGEEVTEQKILTWRLLLPLGSVVRARRTREFLLDLGRLDVNQLEGRVGELYE